LEQLLALAIPQLRDAQRRCPRTGPGRKPDFEDWQIATMILCGVLKKKKSKSAQYRLLTQHAPMLRRMLDLERLPCRSVFCDRYKHCWPLVREAIAVQGRAALREHVADATVAAADKSLVAARGPVWHQRQRRRGKVPKGLHGLDREADWGYSDYHDWVWGYAFELVVTAPAKRSGIAAFPLLASVETASLNEQRALAQKLPRLPTSTRVLALDKGYDADGLADTFEMRGGGGGSGGRSGSCPPRRTPRRHYLCPPRNGRVGRCVRRGAREQKRQRRLARVTYLRGRRGRALYARRKMTIEPFNAIFKGMFELDEHVWHRGLDNNRTQILTAIFCYQLLVRYHRKCCGRRDAQVQYLLDAL
jgi:hypothetical protein